MIHDLAALLSERLSGRVVTRHALAEYTTYRLGGSADLFVEPAGEDDLRQLSDALTGTDVPLLVIGRGSNLVISDDGFPGICVHLDRSFSGIVEWGPPSGSMGTGAEVGGATMMPLLANWTVRRGLAGFEWGVGVPGSVGGGVRMNAGAHSAEIRDTLVQAEVWGLRGGQVSVRSNEELGFSYRRSSLLDDELVTRAWFGFTEEDIETVRQRAETYRLKRAESQPGAAQNAGSVFKNPPDDHAGRLVEAAGLKGFTVGGARVSEIHANFFIAPEGTTAQDVFDLVHEVKRRVEAAQGVVLEPEVRFVGAFEHRSPEGIVDGG